MFSSGPIITISRLAVERATLERESCEKKFLLFCLLEAFPYGRIVFRAATTNGKTIFFCQLHLGL
jgi:hypothetical protein